ncbi:hypothetical protein VNO77_12995 [Canavalia gladiata]|uniref:Uncharacterized protein n=1 Tax=Canavalia gladiata TaxID=3824 RepID=A0AAN9QUR1_CANGL
MGSPSCFKNHLSISKIISIHVICVVPFGANHDVRVLEHSHTPSYEAIVPNSSPFTPKKIIKRIGKATMPYMWIKTKEKEGLSPISNKFIKKISKGIHYMRLKTKNKEDDKCLWKKTIMMGEKCQPLEFSGLILYDNNGNQLSEPPRSPRSNSLLS